MKYYPIFLDLRGRRVLVVGAGKIALRKARGLVDAGARVTVVAPQIRPEIRELPVRLVERGYRPSDLDGSVLVFAATDDREVNRRIGVAASRRGILANIADAAEECDFIVPARVQQGPVEIAIATGGRSPRVSAELRRKLEKVLPPDDRIKKERGVWVSQGKPTNKSIPDLIARGREARIRNILKP